MDTRQRILAILNGDPPDCIPWVPRLEIWYAAAQRAGTLPQEWQGKNLREIEAALGLGTPARDGKVFNRVHENNQVVSRQSGSQTILSFETPLGSLQQVTVQTEDRWKKGLPGVVSEHFLKTPDDYRIWEYIVQNDSYQPAYEEYLQYDRSIGGDGLPMVAVSPSPFYYFLEVLVGYQNAFYHLADYPQQVNHLLSAMAEVQKTQEWPLIANSPAQLILTDAHISTQFTPPKVYLEHIQPYNLQLNDYLHEHGKWTAMHADADTSHLLTLIEQTGWDMVECFITAPMVPLSLEQARAAWGERMIIWGGIPSLLLSPTVPEGEFRAYVERLFEAIAPGKAFILGVADNVMPDSLIERIAWITERVNARGWYPIGS